MHVSGLIWLLLVLSSARSSEKHSISKRYLLFPRYTVLQFTTGLSVPLILPTRSINLSWCVQSNYDLPYNLTNFEIHNLRSYIGDVNLDIDRITFYKYVIAILDGFGLEGEICLLRAVCDVAETPMHTFVDSYVLEKLIHYILTPSLDLSTSSEKEPLQNQLLEAENYGKNGSDCLMAFNDCDISLVDIFTKKFYLFD